MKLLKLTFALVLLFVNIGALQSKNVKNNNDANNLSKSTAVINAEKFSFDSKILTDDMDISIAISLPHKYAERKQSYPVIFVLEGDYLFDITRATAKFMARRSHMPESIVVGIYAGEDEHRKRMAVKLHGGKPDMYVNFLKKELIPYVEKQYRANSHRSIIGLSPTNGVLFESFLNEPDLFKGYIALSTHLEWPPEKGKNMIDEVISRMNNTKLPKATLYMGRADDDLESNQYAKKIFDEAQKKLAKTSSSNTKVVLDILENEEHYMMSLAGLRNGFQLIYPHGGLMYTKTLASSDKPAEILKKDYQEISSSYGFDVYPVEDGHVPNDHLLGLVDIFERKKEYSKALDILKLGINYYPNSANLYRRLALRYQFDGEAERAKKHAETSLKLVKKYNPDLLKKFQNDLNEIVD